MNVGLDILLVGYMNFGIAGAAYASDGRNDGCGTFAAFHIL